MDGEDANRDRVFTAGFWLINWMVDCWAKTDDRVILIGLGVFGIASYAF